MNRIDRKFKTLKIHGKKAFIAFLTCGYPDLATTEKLVLEFEKAGVDIVELGIPFSDPIADGPVIQESSVKALAKKVTTADVLKLVKRLRRKTQMPLCAMTYYNLIFRFGEEKFLREARKAGLDGLIIPDLPVEEAGPLISLSHSYGIDVVLFLAPTTSKNRARQIVKKARGFIYYVSLTGVTGQRTSLPADLAANLKEIKKLTGIPVCVGFGVSRPEHVRLVYKVADGAIVGSAIIGQIKKNIGKTGLAGKVGRFVKGLANV